ncbi:MAG: hypothetical protein ACI4NM_09400 [Bullifex sp.]
MFDEFSSWLCDNPGFYPCLDEVISRLGRNATVLCAGEYSVHAALIIREFVNTPVDVLLSHDSDIPEEILNAPGLRVTDRLQGPYTFVYAPLFINMIEKKDVVPFLLDVYDVMKSESEAVFTFFDSVAVTPSGLSPFPSFFGGREEVMMKLYTVSDVVNALSMIGLKIRSVDRMSADLPFPCVYVDSLKF